MPTEHPLEARVRRHLVALGLGQRPVRLLVAFSGGCDSVVLLQLLRFRFPSLPIEVTAAHLDHKMRPESGEDAAWVRGLCDAWEVPLVSTRLEAAPRNEAEARRERYAFLRRAGEKCGADLIATGHHADDQAETVLFRAVRGTGLTGLAGIPAIGDGLIRPLLPVWRSELEAYARGLGLGWRTDVTNSQLDPARNWLRHEVLPLIETQVAPGARRSLVSLAALAAEAEQALQRIASEAEVDLVTWDEGTPSLARDRLRLYDSAIASRVLRNLLRHFGVVLGRTGTRRALQFITDAHSGRQMPLSGTLRIDIEFDRALFRNTGAPPEDRPHEIAEAHSSGEAEVRIGGAEYVIRYGPAEIGYPASREVDGWGYAVDPASLEFPLRVRGWRPGDRVQTPTGERSLKRVFLERRVPRERRHRLPLLVDARGSVIWIAGLAAEGPGDGGGGFVVRVLHD